MTPFGHWLNFRAISYAEAGRALGVSRAYVQALAAGDASPRFATVGRAIEDWTRELDLEDFVPVASWVPYCPQFAGLKLA